MHIRIRSFPKDASSKSPSYLNHNKSAQQSLALLANCSDSFLSSSTWRILTMDKLQLKIYHRPFESVARRYARDKSKITRQLPLDVSAHGGDLIHILDRHVIFVVSSSCRDLEESLKIELFRFQDHFESRTPFFHARH